MRNFLFLQGPHGPFFKGLARQIRASGAQVWRVGFNAGDEAFWGKEPGYIPFLGTHETWPETLLALFESHAITDIALYGDTRPIHAFAVEAAEARGIRVHIFEEGYLRPWWVTYERHGSNGNSELMQMSLAQMSKALHVARAEIPEPPAHWGDMRQHIFYGAVYHWYVFALNKKYKNFKRHRELTVSQEAILYTRRLLLMPYHAITRRLTSRRIRRGGFPYHLVMLQLEHDSSFQFHSPFKRMSEFIEVVMRGFASGAPRHHHLVFKAHPLESGRFDYAALINGLAKELDLTGRVHFLAGGKLGLILTPAKSALTVNSTAGQQALWRGIPTRIFGDAIYNKPEFVSQQPLQDFFAQPQPPDHAAYKLFRDFLLSTSQVPGGYYSAQGRRQLVRHIPDLMLAERGPYDGPFEQE